MGNNMFFPSSIPTHSEKEGITHIPNILNKIIHIEEEGITDIPNKLKEIIHS